MDDRDSNSPIYVSELACFAADRELWRAYYLEPADRNRRSAQRTGERRHHRLNIASVLARFVLFLIAAGLVAYALIGLR